MIYNPVVKDWEKRLNNAIMNVTLKHRGNSYEEMLYKALPSLIHDKKVYRVKELGENIAVVQQLIWGWWKHRYLVDNYHCRAYEIMDESMDFVHFTHDDTDWASIEQLPDCAKLRARELSAQFPTFVRPFKNGVAEVGWQLNPDGRYYMDEDSYGMTSDEEITVYGFIDARMNVLVKFRYIGKDYGRLHDMRHEAESILRSRTIKCCDEGGKHDKEY